MRRVELVRIDDRDPSRRRGQPLGGTSDDCDLIPELDDDRPQVEDDLPSLGADELALVLEQQHELPMGRRHDLDPGSLGTRPLQDALGSLVGGLAGETGEGRCESALRLGETLGDGLLDVDVGVQLLDGDQRDLLADRIVLNQVRRDPLDSALVSTVRSTAKDSMPTKATSTARIVRTRAAIRRMRPGLDEPGSVFTC